MPSGSAMWRPSIWYPPQSPSTWPPRRRWATISAARPLSRSTARSAMVVLEPGSSTSATSAGSTSPGCSSSSSTPGSASRGSRSSKLAMRGSTGTAMRTRPASRPLCAQRAVSASAMASSAGSRRAGAKCGTRPRGCQPVRAAIIVMPCANRAGSPRKRLTMKPPISAASAGSSTAAVPTRLAMTPPRSISPMSTTGTPAACAKPMLAMSPARRLISEALPAPSTSTRSASAARRPKLSSTAGSRAPRSR